MKHVVKEALRGVPHLVMVRSNSIHGIRNPKEVLQKSESNVLVHRVVIHQDECNFQHILTIKCHPCRAVRLVEVPAGRQLSTAVEDADIVQSQESSGKDVLALWILSVDPPVEIQHQPLERTFQEAHVCPAEFLFDVKEEQRRPGMYRRIHVAEVPLVCGKLPVGMRIKRAQHQQQLLFCEIEIYH